MFEELTPEERKAVADIKIKAMMFDMDIDWETASLIPKRKEAQEPQWLINFKDKRQQSDNDPSSPEEAMLI